MKTLLGIALVGIFTIAFVYALGDHYQEASYYMLWAILIHLMLNSEQGGSR